MGKSIQVPHDLLKELASKLGKDCDDLGGQGSGTPYHLAAGGQLQDNDLGAVTGGNGTFKAAQGFLDSAKAAYQYTSSTYDNFLTSYQGLVQSLGQTTKNHRDTEQATTDASRGGKTQAY